ncbi:prevent-host-death family protein [Jatrophihabitans endophyticus]|uniref:Prevent-host-death family protein n=1 Tax=Jatrophihabitans endophyticus TaxID=1206085 RepID=A0A1M5ECK2_9ACTN|nr:type II toxin-antitoxin system prevent-host-death family antitoxin [Jatrophihabitans endophyticus]SHF76916.1 prevent-host-death family protein [Jatrophihabitans endophyticus]
MRTVTHREMRNSSGELLRAVAAGESVLVTNNGRVTAVLSPPGTIPLVDLAARGQARPPRAPRSDLAAVRRGSSARTTGELIADVRGHW